MALLRHDSLLTIDPPKSQTFFYGLAAFNRRNKNKVVTAPASDWKGVRVLPAAGMKEEEDRARQEVIFFGLFVVGRCSTGGERPVPTCGCIGFSTSSPQGGQGAGLDDVGRRSKARKVQQPLKLWDPITNRQLGTPRVEVASMATSACFRRSKAVTR